MHIKGLILFLILQTILTGYCNSQEDAPSPYPPDFHLIMDACIIRENEENPNTQIEVDSYYKYFGHDSKKDSVTGVIGHLFYGGTNNMTLIVEVFVSDSIYRSYLEMATFTARGKLIRKMFLDSSCLTKEGGYFSNVIKYKREILEIKRMNIKYNSGLTIDSTNIINTYQYYIIDEHSYEKIIPFASSGRKYPEISLMIMDYYKVQDYPKEELEFMEQELYAQHGLDFKDKKWKEYFSKQSWYKVNPNFSLSLFTAIENVNREYIHTERHRN